MIRCVVNPGMSLGEGPVWDAGSSRLYWVDILENRIYRHDPASERTESWSTPEHVGFVFAGENGSLLAGFASGLHRVTLGDDGTVDASRIDRVDTRFNDATRDRDGGIWACTLGRYYHYDAELNRRDVDDNYCVANGPALSPDGRLLYTVETRGHAGRPKGVYVSQVTRSGTLERQRLLIGWDGHASSPDGIVTDRDGNLWLGEFEGNVLRRFDAAGAQTAAIPLPAWNVTKPAFGGERGDVLYVTSARYGVDDEMLARYPDTGGVVEIAGIGSVA
ncbi:MAG: SMP-30/gluconolactonase/LRE family protein [Gaiellaceae bacterium]